MSIFSMSPQTRLNRICSRRLRERIDQLRAKNSQGADEDDVEFASVASEVEDEESSPPTYNIFTYPADFTLEVLVDKWAKEDIIVPKFQRRPVWTPPQKSSLIESFLHGLPVPPIYLFNDLTINKLLVVDGHQRMNAIAEFFESVGEDGHGKKKAFRLAGLNKKSAFYNKTYSDLEESNVAAFNKLNNSVLRSFIIKQEDPKDDTSIYHIFERLNTGGTLLRGQEIRNCLQQGPFNNLLLKLNKPEDTDDVSKQFAASVSHWRDILGKPKADKRLRDVELILRFFALHFDVKGYKPPMKIFLNRYMRTHRYLSETEVREHEKVFQNTVNAVFKSLGETPFHIEAGLNIAAFDAVFVAFAQNLGRIPQNIAARYEKLKANAKFKKYIKAATTNKEVIPARIKLAKDILFG